MKNIFIILLIIVCECLFAQQPKGAGVNNSVQNTKAAKTYALICGISKYKNPAIPALQFADKDAIAFYTYLKSTGVDSNNIILLLNDQAKSGDIWTEVDYITSIAKKGDKVFFYFSGHGDLESKIVSQDAYLLPYDAPKVVYASGAISIQLLKGYLATLSSNSVQVVFIADACHSGNLAGGREGMDATSIILKEKWKDEIKILSCQSGELSLEGKQWGNGRGLFSYELINGLAGLADKDNDGIVSLYELNLYITEKVHDGASPVPQHPVVTGNMEYHISNSDSKILEKINSKQIPVFAAIDVRGLDETFGSVLNDSIKLYYQKFNEYLSKGIYYSEDESNVPTAYYYYLKISDNEQTHLLVSLMKRNLCATIMNDISIGFDLLIQNREEKISARQEKFIFAASSLLRKILGDDKLQHLGFLSKTLVLQAARTRDLSQAKIALNRAIELDPGAAYVYYFRGLLLYRNTSDSAIFDFKKAIALSPGFILPHEKLIDMYLMLGQFDSALFYSNRLSKMGDDRTLFSSFKYDYRIYVMRKMNDSANHYLNEMISMSDSSNDFYFIKYSGSNFYEIENYPLAIKFYSKARVLNLRDTMLLYYLICSYSMNNDKKNALKYFEELLEWARSDDFGKIERTSEFNNIRNTSEYKALMKKHFPERYKK